MSKNSKRPTKLLKIILKLLRSSCVRLSNYTKIKTCWVAKINLTKYLC